MLGVGMIPYHELARGPTVHVPGAVSYLWFAGTVKESVMFLIPEE